MKVGSAAQKAIEAIARTCGAPTSLGEKRVGEIANVFRHLNGSWVGFFTGEPSATALLRKVVSTQIKLALEKTQPPQTPSLPEESEEELESEAETEDEAETETEDEAETEDELESEEDDEDDEDEEEDDDDDDEDDEDDDD